VKLYWDARRRMEFLQVPEHWLLLLHFVYIYLIWCYLNSHQNSMSLLSTLEVLFSSTSAFSFLFYQPWVLFRKWIISHKTHTISQPRTVLYYQCFPGSFLITKLTVQKMTFTTKPTMQKKHLKDHSTQTHCTEQTAWFGTENWEPAVTVEMFLAGSTNTNPLI